MEEYVLTAFGLTLFVGLPSGIGSAPALFTSQPNTEFRNGHHDTQPAAVHLNMRIRPEQVILNVNPVEVSARVVYIAAVNRLSHNVLQPFCKIRSC